MELEKLNGSERKGPPNLHHPRDKQTVVISLLLFIVIALLIVIIVLVKLYTTNCTEHAATTEKIAFPLCKNEKVILNTDYIDQSNVFRELTLTEMSSIENYVYKNFKNNRSKLNRPIYDTIFIQNIELYLPNKEDVLNYLEKSEKQPERLARVTLIHYPFNITYYVVGQLPNPTYHKLAKFNDRENSLNEFATGMYRRGNVGKLNRFSKQIFIDMWPLMKDTYEEFEGYDTPEDLFEAGLNIDPFAETVNKENEMYVRIYWMLDTNHRSSHTYEFSYITVLVNITNGNESAWDVIGVTYGLENFKDIETVMDLYRKNKIGISKIKKASDIEKEKAELRKRGSQQHFFDSQEPMLVSPNGPRFSVEGRQVTYLDWKFNFLVQSSSGPALFNVQFKDQRIAYELSLQEAASFYSTGSPPFGSLNILDSTYSGLGKASSLIHGIDCPHHSVYQDAVIFLVGVATRVKNAVCIFEQNPSVPLRRHHHSTGKDSYTYGGMNDASLVIRFITDMYNYDYIHDFVFHQNGAIEIKTILTGVLVITPFYNQLGKKHGYKVIRNNLGPYHDHIMLFKLDLDILGTKNSFKTIDVVTEKFADPWEAYPVTKKLLKENKRPTELNATIKYNFDKPKYYILYNENESNSYGNVRGYRIVPVDKVKQVYPDDHIGTKATQWSKYQLSISKYNEGERYGSCMFNFFPQHQKPLCSFDKRLEDDENIVNEDLVAWVPVGSMHIPSTEDYPTTATLGNQLTLFIKPFNYFDEDPSMASADNVYIAKTKSKIFTNTNSTPREATCSIPERNIH